MSKKKEQAQAFRRDIVDPATELRDLISEIKGKIQEAYEQLEYITDEMSYVNFESDYVNDLEIDLQQLADYADSAETNADDLVHEVDEHADDMEAETTYTVRCTVTLIKEYTLTEGMDEVEEEEDAVKVAFQRMERDFNKGIASGIGRGINTVYNHESEPFGYTLSAEVVETSEN